MPHLRDLDALTGIPVRRGPATDVRYERATPGELIHIDVKKLGRIPDGGGWRMHGRTAEARRHRLVGFDYVHAAIDDHSRVAYAEIHPDETGATCAGFLNRAAEFFATCGITRIWRVMTDNAFAYRLSDAFPGRPGAPGGAPCADPAPLPLAERQSGALQSHPADRMGISAPIYEQRPSAPHALPEWLEYYNTRRRHSALGGRAPISRLSPMR